ncbi:hypothetical protein AVEN_263532-1 [Araneus ventricosus]|uniref:Uncharacterized protein n=1 Tax=Araneus ventricosus TaxID=182803 RepID=A0A4Y2RBK0_ARAVE|nr:hypothetical protein AVEN_263532-1 [Araneus ventricosus]
MSTDIRAMEIVNNVLDKYGSCPVFNCAMHPGYQKKEDAAESETVSCTEMDTESIDEERILTHRCQLQRTDDSDFQMVSPRKAAKTTTIEHSTLSKQEINTYPWQRKKATRHL